MSFARSWAVPVEARTAIRTAMRELFMTQGLMVEPSSAITAAFVKAHLRDLQEPICIIPTGDNITREDFYRLIDEPAA